ncbi:surfeit locus protein 1-like isoform X1 [Homarus americanus]|uniref:surfeit locus protein 1-like isoform X1 n=1 Tax=Homarus americanus TaxID=6706 RepID=UPI001C46B78D|nr:surfeit locus protein 1-like isoform X1 [Homarus americanus]XP_042215333.1 surfeit locus protein 1-like isoform X1 [Homarus americanus]
MSCMLRQGLSISRGILVVSRGRTSPAQIHTTRCSVQLRLIPRQSRSLPVRMMCTRTGKVSVGPSSLFLLIIPIGTFCLGTWQLQRRKWKLNLIAELQAKSNVPPVDLPLELSELEDLEFQRVKMTGSFDHSKEVFLGPRPLLVGGDVHEAGSGLISSGQSGYLVVTPFKLADRDLTVLVNRGWVPRKQKNPESRLEGQIEGLVEVTAVVRRGENRAPFMPNNTKGSPIFTFRDVPTMARMLGTAPVFLDATDTFPGGPQGGQTRVTMRNEHLSYMMTWYSLSLATSYLWYRRFIMGKALM